MRLLFIWIESRGSGSLPRAIGTIRGPLDATGHTRHNFLVAKHLCGAHSEHWNSAALGILPAAQRSRLQSTYTGRGTWGAPSPLLKELLRYAALQGGLRLRGRKHDGRRASQECHEEVWRVRAYPQSPIVGWAANHSFHVRCM